MIREIGLNSRDEIVNFLKQEYGVNYFIRLGLAQNRTVFRKIWEYKDTNSKALLFQRKSGNLHLSTTKNCELCQIAELIKKLSFQKVMGDLSVIRRLYKYFPECDLTKNSYVASYQLSDKDETIMSTAEQLELTDLPEVIELYETIFSGFPKLEYLQDKLAAKRGSGFLLKDCNKKVISIVQTDFEEDYKATITGVGTTIDHQREGLSFQLMQHTHTSLRHSGFQKVYLQYDDEKAGKLYRKLGYKIESRIGNLINSL